MRLLWFQCCESYWHKGRGINFSKRSENLNERRTFKREAYGTCGPVNWKGKNKDQTSLQWHIATWWQEMKIKAMWGNSCTRSSFHYGSFLWCVCSLIFKSLAGSQKLTPLITGNILRVLSCKSDCMSKLPRVVLYRAASAPLTLDYMLGSCWSRLSTSLAYFVLSVSVTSLPVLFCQNSLTFVGWWWKKKWKRESSSE